MKVKRAGFVYSLYKRNLINLWIVAGLLLAMAAAMTVKSANYLMNYLFYRREPDQAALTAFLEPTGWSWRRSAPALRKMAARQL